MLENEVTIQGSNFKDRKTWLIVFGILEIILGLFCALASVGMTISTLLMKTSAEPISAGTIIPGILLYMILAAWFIWMGIGSIGARRWARALLLVSSWIGLIGGICGLIFLIIFIPGMSDQAAQSAQTPQGIPSVVRYVMFGFTAFFFVVIPGVLVLFYGSRNVKATCESRDPKVRWTDRCPLPVLAVSLIYGFWAFSLLCGACYGWVIPFFGTILSGISGAVVSLVYILLCVYVVWGAYKLNIKAWWCAVLVNVAWAVSAGITFSHGGLWSLYEKMNFSEQQLDAMKQMMPHNSTITLLFMVMFIVFLGYIFYTKRYFVTSSTIN